ncbi:MAG: hypothetical protein U1F16_15970 [Turneriella sp.]
MKMKHNKFFLAVLMALLMLAACARKKKSDDFQTFGGVSYNAAPKTLATSLGLNIAVQPIDIDFDGKSDGLYVCRTGGIKKFTISNAGSGYTDSPTVTVAGTCTTNPTARAVVANGRVERIIILTQGVGCSNNNFSVTLTGGGPGAGGAGAQVTGASGGKVTRITVTNKGAGYSAPDIAISGGGGTGATAGVTISGGQITAVDLLNTGDQKYTTAPTISVTGGGGTGAVIDVIPDLVVPANSDLIPSELDANGNCSVTYDPTNVDKDKRYIPQMLFTWPITPTIGLDTNGDGNADYFLLNNSDGTSQVMTNSDGSGAVAKLIVKNPAIDETNDWLYRNLNYGQVIGFDILNNNTISNNILGKIALDREDAGYVNAADPTPIISPIRDGEFYAAPLDVNILCSDKVACNAITYSLSNGAPPVPPDFSNTNLDLTGLDTTGTKHTIKPGDSATIAFQSLPYGNYKLSYIVRDAAGRTSAVQTKTFTIGKKPDVTILGVTNRYVSTSASTQASFQWTADTGSLTKKFRYMVVVNGSCYGFTRADYFRALGSPQIANVVDSSWDPRGATPPGQAAISSGTPITTTILANDPGMVLNDATDKGLNYITICAITCEPSVMPGTCNDTSGNELSVWGDAYETVIRDDTAPTISVSPLSGIFDKPLRITLTGSTTVGSAPTNGTLAPVEICYTWGSDGSGNPQPNVPAADPSFPCTTSGGQVAVAGSETSFNLGCSGRASVNDLSLDPNSCPFTAGIYYLKYIARDAAGNLTAIVPQAYAVNVVPQVTTNTPPAKHVWQNANSWGNSATNSVGTRTSTTWTWQTDFPGTYEIRYGATISGTGTPGDPFVCTGGTASTHASGTGTVLALTPVVVTLLASDMVIGTNDVKVCFTPSGGGSVATGTQSIWRVEPLNINTTYNKVHFSVGSPVTLSLADIFTDVSSVYTITFTCPAGSFGVDANNGCQQPVAAGTTIRAQGTGSVEVNTLYNIPVTPAGRVTTIAYDVSITVCDANTPSGSGCTTSAGPTFATNNYTANTPIKFFILKDATANQSIYVDASQVDDSGDGLSRATAKKYFRSAVALATPLGKAIYIKTGTYCENETAGAGCPSPAALGGTINLENGVSVYGGYDSNWYRPNVDNNRATINTGRQNTTALTTQANTGSNTILRIDDGVCGVSPLLLPGRFLRWMGDDQDREIMSCNGAPGGYDEITVSPALPSAGSNVGGISVHVGHSIGVYVRNVTTATSIEGLIIDTRRATPPATTGLHTIGLMARGGNNTLTLYKNSITARGGGAGAGPRPGGIYGVYASGGTLSLTMTTNTITAESGWPGSSGGAGGATGANALPNAQNGGAGVDTGCLSSCGTVAGGTGGNGATGGIPGFNNGGRGGDGGNSKGTNGSDGLQGGNTGGAGGPHGNDGGTPFGCSQPSGTNGSGGSSAGSAGPNGNNGNPPLAYNFGEITAGFLAAYKGDNGLDGPHGRGGGGGGGGAGSDACEEASAGGGGGGGGGGAGGTGGEGGWFGGASVGVFAYSIQSITMSGNTVIRGTGGNAGTGKAGGSGGSGSGGAGGGPEGDGDAGNGGGGGTGSAGADGGNGTGGNGGQSFGIVVNPNVASCPAVNSHLGGGVGTGTNNGINRQCAVFGSVAPMGAGLVNCPANCGGSGP